MKVSNLEVALSLGLQMFFDLVSPARPGSRHDTAALAAVKLERLRGRLAADGVIIRDEVLKNLLPEDGRIAAAAAVLAPYGDDVLWDVVDGCCPSGFTRRTIDSAEAEAQVSMIVGPQLFGRTALDMAAQLEAMRLEQSKAEAPGERPGYECDLGDWLGEKD